MSFWGDRGSAAPWIFRARPLSGWVTFWILLLYLFGCLLVFYRAIDPIADFKFIPRVEADATGYWYAAGLLAPDIQPPENTKELGIGANLLGPVLLAKVFRTRGAIALFNTVLLCLMVQAAGAIPGVRKNVFLLLMLANGLTLPSIITLNKEILAAAGLIFFANYIYSAKRPKWLLFLAMLFSGLARWEQPAILFLFLAMESRLSPVRGRRRWGVALTIGAITVGYPLALRAAHVDLTAFLLQTVGAGTIVTLNNLQGKFGFPLVVFPKILMNVMGRLITPSYFLTTYWTESFWDLENQVIIHLHELAITILFAVAFVRGRLRLARPLVYLIALYLILTSVNPFVQPRYEYPAYALLCLEMARREDALEPAAPRLTARIRGLLRSPLALSPGSSGTMEHKPPARV